MKTVRQWRWVLPIALLGGACSSLIGIEDIYEDPKGDEGPGGENGNGGSSSGQGGTSGSSGQGGSSGSSGASGRGGSSGDTGGSDTGGSSGDAGGGGTSGDGATGGSDTGGSSTGGGGGMGDMTVRGRVVTTWMQPIPNITVMIGNAEADTNANGEFEIPDVAEEYDAKFVVNFDASGVRTYGWAYLGLTRRDPTLQVYNGLTSRSGYIAVTPMNLTGTDFSNRKLMVAFGGDDVDSTREITLPNGLGQGSTTWQGPQSTPVTAHALLFEHGANDIPSVYRAYDQTLGVLSETQSATFVFNLADETVAGGTVSGSVTSASSSDRTNYVFARFESNASMELIEHYGSTLDPNSFTYSVPTVPSSSIEVGAVEGTWSFSAMGLAHRDRLAPGAMDVALEIPTPAQQVAPAHQVTGVDGSTVFSWTSQAQAFVFGIENVDPNSPFVGMYIVTGEKRASIPEFPNGFTLIPDDLHNWRVEIHGDATSVDELAGPEGFADSWAPYGEGPNSPKRGDGTFSISAGRNFTTAP